MRPDERPRETPGRPEDVPGLTSYREAQYTFIWGTEKHSLLLLEPKLLRTVRGDEYAPYRFDYLVTSEGGRTRAYSTPGMREALLEYGQRYLDAGFVERLRADCRAFHEVFRSFLLGLQARNWRRLSDEALAALYDEYFWHLVDAYTYFALTFGWKLEAASAALRDALAAHLGVDPDEREHLEVVLSSPTAFNEVARERLAWLRLLEAHEQDAALDRAVALAHVREFPWLAFNTYDEGDVVSFLRSKFDHYRAAGARPAEDLAAVQGNLQARDDEQRRILARLGSERIDRLSGVLRWASEERLDLKWFWAGGEYLARGMLDEIAARIGISLHEFLHTYKSADIAAALRDGTRLPRAEMERRLQRVTYLVTDGRLFFSSGHDAERLEAELVDRSDGSGSLLRGSPAFPGRVSGPVKIIKVDDLRSLQRDFERFERGDVLVTTMTQPNIVMLIERASAVLTDEGGITSHAAVLCRELRIPCIIGLHTATIDLAEGDVVNVDAFEGTVAIAGDQRFEPAPAAPAPGPPAAVDEPAGPPPRPELVLWLSDVGRDDGPSVGGKVANLGELSGRFAVPAGFCVTTSGYRAFLEHNDLERRSGELLEPADLDDPHALEAIADRVRALIELAEVPEQLREAIEDAYRRLGPVPVAVRSSATAEDSARASFAGQFDSLLGVSGAEDVVAAVKACWASLFTARSLFYRSRAHAGGRPPSMAVLVQEMVDPDYAGVIFTVHPVSRRHMLIEAVEGLGEALVSGRRTPNRYVVADDQTVVERSESFDLDDDTIHELARFGRDVAAALQQPADIEFAIARGSLYLLQARPITTLAGDP
jgi:phosphohistidine swiveling domain-containing protein